MNVNKNCYLMIPSWRQNNFIIIYYKGSQISILLENVNNSENN